MQPPGWRGHPARAPRTAHSCRGSASRERNHGVGDHPIPFRTRQLSPPSPKVLQRQAAGGQGVALMQGASAYIKGLTALFCCIEKGAFKLLCQYSSTHFVNIVVTDSSNHTVLYNRCMLNTKYAFLFATAQLPHKALRFEYWHNSKSRLA